MPAGFDDLCGEVIEERFEISEVVDASSRVVVFGGRDQQTDRAILLRLERPLRLHDESTLKRLEQRAKVASHVRHRSVTPPLAWGERFDGKLYVVFERPAGDPLERFLARQPHGRSSWEQARPLLLELAGALAAAHGRHVVHGSLEPRSCWVAPGRDEELRAQLLYLGTNTDPESEAPDAALSGTTNIGGDGIFVAPETAGGLYGDERTDVYLFGLLAYTVLTGQPPFRGRNQFHVISMHMGNPVPTMSEQGVEVLGEVEALVRHALAKDPAQRPANMLELERMLRELDGRGQPQVSATGASRGRAGRGRAARAKGGRPSATKSAAPGPRMGSASPSPSVAPSPPSPQRSAPSYLPAPPLRPSAPAFSPSVPAPPAGRSPTPPVPASAPPRSPSPPASVPPMAADEAVQTVAFSRSEFEAAMVTDEPEAAESTMAWQSSDIARFRAKVPTSPMGQEGATVRSGRASTQLDEVGPAGTVQLSAAELRAQRGEIEPEARTSAPNVAAGVVGPERTVALTAGQLRGPDPAVASALDQPHGPERTVALTMDPAAGPERTVALTMDPAVGPEHTAALAPGQHRGTDGTVALTPNAGMAPVSHGGTTVLSRDELLGRSGGSLTRGGAQVVAPPSPAPAASTVGPLPAPSTAPPSSFHSRAGMVGAPPLAPEAPKARVGMWVVVFALIAVLGVAVGIMVGGS